MKGSIRIDGIIHEHDVVIEGGEIRKRKKKPSKKFRDELWTYPAVCGGKHSLEVPPAGNWYRSYGKLPVMTDVKREPSGGKSNW